VAGISPIKLAQTQTNLNATVNARHSAESYHMSTQDRSAVESFLRDALGIPNVGT
jgi:hypothetical protein